MWKVDKKGIFHIYVAIGMYKNHPLFMAGKSNWDFLKSENGICKFVFIIFIYRIVFQGSV